jgi:hypothetical protein
MNPLIKLLVAVTAMSVIGIVRGEAADQVPNPDTPAPTGSGSHFASGVSASYSFADIVYLPAGAEHRLLTAGTFSRVPDRPLAELSNVTDSTPTRPAGANTTGSLLGAAWAGAIDDLSAVVVPDDSPSSRSATAGSHTGAGLLFSAAEIPAPAGWMTLLCCLVVVAFMARRRSGPFEG